MGLLGAPGVDWSITSETGRFEAPPGGSLQVSISFRPQRALEARRVMAALVATEEYQYKQREHGQREGSSSRTWGSAEIHRQEVQLLGPGTIGAGEMRGGPVAFSIPASGAPSFESAILRVRWKLIAWIDVGGRDARTEQAVTVPQTITQLNPADAVTMGQQVQVVADDQPVSFWATPAPIRSGAPFSGSVDVRSPLALSDVRIELRLTVATRMSGGLPGATLLGLAGLGSTAGDRITEHQVLWRGTLTDGGLVDGWHRYLYAGQWPDAPVVTADFPHGEATATLDVILGRRLRPDRHITRPVAIVTG